MRVKFNQLFDVTDNQIFAKTPIRISGVMTLPGSTLMLVAETSGIDLTQHLGSDLEIEENNGVTDIKGIYG